MDPSSTAMTGPQTVSASGMPFPSSLPIPRAKGMQLGINKVPSSATAAILAEQWADDTTESLRTENPWGNDDLIDVNADEDDWSRYPVLNARPLFTYVSGAFETAPADLAPKATTPSQLPFGLNENGTPNQHLLGGKTPPSVCLPTSTTKPNSRGRNENSKISKHSPSPTPTTLSCAEMTKEEKAAEMARRKEERKQVNFQPFCHHFIILISMTRESLY